MDTLLALLVPTIALPRLDRSFCLFLHVLAKGTALIVRLAKLSLRIAPHISLISAGIYQLAVALFWHCTLLDDV